MFRKNRIYLDRAAGASGNPSSPHQEGQAAKERLEAARTTIARLVEAQADDVIFTSGATEGNALAILGVAHAWAKKHGRPPQVLYLPTAHASIVENANLLASFGARAVPLPVREYRVDTEALSNMLTEDTALVTMEAVCGETGVIWNTREVADVLAKSGHKTLLHVDASQAPLTEKLARSHFGADLLTLDGSKVGNARGIGALIARPTIPVMPLYGGGGGERGLRPGSQSPELAEHFAEALARAAKEREEFRSAASHMRASLVASITKDVQMPGVYINEGRMQVPHILNLSAVGRDTDYLVALLDEAGFAISTRSACETDSEEGSRAVQVLTGNQERAKATLRISWGSEIRASDLERFAEELGRAVHFVDRPLGG